MLSTTMSETLNQEVILDDIDGDTMLEILRYMYMDEAQNVDTLATKLLYGAEKYNLNALKEICIESLLESLSLNNVIDYLILADRYSSEILLRKCISLIEM